MRLFNHPIHPMLVHFPIAAWSFAALSDGLAFMGYAPAWPYAWLMLAAGLVMALPAMTAGFLDLSKIEEKAMSVATYHMTLMGTAWTLYLFAFLTRSEGLKPLDHIEILPVLLDGIGFVVLATGGWFGGQLVYGHGVGVNKNSTALEQHNKNTSHPD